MGFLGNSWHPEVEEAIMDGLATSHAAGKPIGRRMADPRLSEAYLKAGVDYVAVITDIGLLRQGAAQLGARQQPVSHQARAEALIGDARAGFDRLAMLEREGQLDRVVAHLEPARVALATEVKQQIGQGKVE